MKYKKRLMKMKEKVIDDSKKVKIRELRMNNG